jgi:peptidoglycan/xylan/chitin deacetylase (PgdA/CDA1 family)
MNFHRLFSIASLCMAVSTPLFAQDTAAVPAGAPGIAAPAPDPKISYGSVHVDGPYIALTFDDGPSAKLTPQLLKVLEEKNIKATFFLIGENVQAHPEIVKQEIADGDAVGSHTWDHPNLGVMPDDKVRSELQRTDDAIFNATGVHPQMLRPPYGSLAHGQRIWINKEFGYRIIFWSVDPLDWKDPGADVVASRILAAAKPGSIILSHDIHAGTVAAMPGIIDALLAKGYKFVTVPQLIAMSTPAPVAPPKSAAAKSNPLTPAAARPGDAPATPIFQ